MEVAKYGQCKRFVIEGSSDEVESAKIFSLFRIAACFIRKDAFPFVTYLTLVRKTGIVRNRRASGKR
jgi:hypothetical protein